MRFGANTPLVEEVLTLSKGPLVPKLESVPGGSWTAVVDAEEARRLCWDGQRWTDLRGREMGAARGAIYRPADYRTIRDALWEACEEAFETGIETLDDRLTDLADDIFADLHGIATSRAGQGAVGFYELPFQTYRAGGFPCGWNGEYPEGRLLAYFDTASF